MLLLVVGSAAFSDRAALAQGPPINTDTPIMLGLQGRGLRTFGKVIRRARLLRDGEEIDDAAETTVTVNVIPIAVPYNLMSDKLQVGVVAPFMNVDVTSIQGDVSNAGIGDLQLFTKYLVYQRDRPKETIRIASKVGIKLPTGDDDGTPALGTGSTDYFFTAVGAWIAGRVGVYGEGIYQLNISKDEVDFGDAVSYNVAFGYRLLPVVYETYPSPQLNAYLELNGTTTRRSSRAGRTLEDSGGTLLFLSPGIQYVGGRPLAHRGIVPVPYRQRTERNTARHELDGFLRIEGVALLSLRNVS